MMFTVMMMETPLPMPRSVIWSPSHIRNMVPAVMMITVLRMKSGPAFGTSSRGESWAMSRRKGLASGVTSDCANM